MSVQFTREEVLNISFTALERSFTGKINDNSVLILKSNFSALFNDAWEEANPEGSYSIEMDKAVGAIADEVRYVHGKAIPDPVLFAATISMTAALAVLIRMIVQSNEIEGIKQEEEYVMLAAFSKISDLRDTSLMLTFFDEFCSSIEVSRLLGKAMDDFSGISTSLLMRENCHRR